MSIRPAKVIYGVLSSLTVLATWDYDDGTGDPWVGLPYRYRAALQVTAQPHGSHSDGNGGQGFFYTGADIVVGDWVFSSGGARILLVTAVVDNSDPNNIVVEITDDDRVNVANDFTQLGQAGIPEGDCYIFEAQGGIPALYPLPPNLPGPIPIQASAEIMSRFAAMRKDKYVDVEQPDYGFRPGTSITLGADGLYYQANAADPTHVACGVVVECVDSADGPTKFRYLPVGPVVDLHLDGTIGALFYIDEGGAYVEDPLSDFAQPAFIKLSDTRVILINASIDSNHTSQHAGVETLFTAGRTEMDWDADGNLLLKRSYRKTGSVLRHMFTSTYLWDAVGMLTRKDVLRIPDGKLLRIDYVWSPEGNLVTTDRTVI